MLDAPAHLGASGSMHDSFSSVSEGSWWEETINKMQRETESNIKDEDCVPNIIHVYKNIKY